jgi:hypothetical protein
MRDGASAVAHEVRIPDYNLELTAGTERMDSRHRARLFPLVFDVITYSWSFTSCVRYQPFPEVALRKQVNK